MALLPVSMHCVINEPTAAAIAYDLAKKGGESNVFIFEILLPDVQSAKRNQCYSERKRITKVMDFDRTEASERRN